MSKFPVVKGMGGNLQEALTTKVKVQTKTAGNIQHMRYDSYSGEWSFGKDNEDLSGEEVTIITNSIVHGWHRWADQEVFKRMASFLDDLPEKPESVEDRKGKTQAASEARGFQCVLEYEGDVESTQMSWEHSTDGCRRAIDTVLETIMARAQSEPEFLYPVVVLKHDKPYENSYKKGEMIYPPMLEIIGWRNAEGEDAPDETAKIEAPKKTRAAKPKAEPEPEPEPDPEPEAAEEAPAEAEEKPKRQRRRKRSAQPE